MARQKAQSYAEQLEAKGVAKKALDVSLKKQLDESDNAISQLLSMVTGMADNPAPAAAYHVGL